MIQRILRRREVLELIGVASSTLWRWEKKGRFPRAIKLGPNAVGYLETEVDRWIDEKRLSRG